MKLNDLHLEKKYFVIDHTRSDFKRSKLSLPLNTLQISTFCCHGVNISMLVTDTFLLLDFNMWEAGIDGCVLFQMPKQ